MNCRFCGATVSLPFVDLVNAPLSNAYLSAAQLNEPETCYPLKVMVCEKCWLVQIEEYAKITDVFNSRYAYFASYSSTWLNHCREYVDKTAARLALGPDSFVVEVASNDGYLLQYVRERGIPCLGIEPTASTAAAASEKGIESIQEFFGADCAGRLVAQRGHADLMIANNVLAHVPDINDFVEGFRNALKPGGTVTFEFPHLLNLIRHKQFDTIYHEHYSYLSLTTVRAILAAHDLTVYDVEQLPTHGGSLRVYARHADCDALPVRPAVYEQEREEVAANLRNTSGYAGFQECVSKIRQDTLRFLLDCRTAGKQVAAYGAAAKGNTLLNYCGIKGSDLIQYVVDRSPHKQGLFLPGSHIPIVGEKQLRETRPDILAILPWNLRDEIAAQLAYACEWGGRFVVYIPELEIF
jgi:SAM-dependent methyltransferase